MMRSSWMLPVVVTISLAVACGSKVQNSNDCPEGTMDCGPGNWSSDDAGNGDSGDAGANDGSSSDGGGILVPDDATIIFKSEGGFAANGTDTSECTLEDETYTYEVTSAKLTWKLCVIEDGGAKNSYVNGNRTLSSSEVKTLDDALAAVTIHKATSPCGADKPEETLEIDSPTAFAPEIFYDQFYHCGADDGKVYVDGLDGVYSAISQLAH